MMNTSLPSFQHQEEFERLRSVLEGAGFTDKGVMEALDVKEFPSMRGSDAPLLLHRTGHGRPLDTLIRLFLMQVPVDAGALQRVIEPMRVETWVGSGLVRADGTLISAEFMLLPFQGLFIAFDPERRLFSSEGTDYVMGIGASSITLANITVRKPVSLTLDLGTGCAIQALLAARHSERVLAVDRNPRAIGIAAFNARLNGLSHVECREGDLFEPAGQEQFDLIISNPPFVISPEMRFIYRDSGMEGDRVCQKIVRQAPQFLKEGGFCQVLCNWAEYEGQDWRERLAAWFEGTGCDAWVMRSDTQDVARYASTWIQHTERLRGEAYGRRFEEWLAYYKRQGIEAISAGVISMRRSSGGTNWFRAEDGLSKMPVPCGDAILSGFALRDFLETHDDDALLSTRFLVSPDVRLEQQYAPSEGAWVGTMARLSLAKGLAYTGEADPHVARFVGSCDGKRTLNELLVEIAASVGLDPAAIRPTFLQLARRFIERGFVLPVESPPA